MAQPTPSDRELDILKVLWGLGEARVRDIHQALCPKGECAFTTVQTLLRIMADKGLVSHVTKGRTLFYKAKYGPARAASRFLNKVFDGSLDRLVLSMLEAEEISADEMRQLEKLLSEARRRKQ